MEALSVSVVRGGTVEARHRVHAVAVRDGAIVEAAGDPELVCLFRSSAKPVQAVPLVRGRRDLAAEEIAIACASHRADAAQLAAVRSLLAKAGATEDDLECGDQDGRPPGRVHHNCSGKHAGFLALCRARGWETAGYRLTEHPLQRELLAEVAEVACVPPGSIATAVDGCGVLTFALSLRAMAATFSRLPGLDGADRVLQAMRAHPDLVGGTGALDTLLMRARPGWVAKRGAEGLFCGMTEDGLGFALKCEDGSSRALQPALARFMDVDLGTVPVESSRGEIVGKVVVE